MTKQMKTYYLEELPLYDKIEMYSKKMFNNNYNFGS